MSIQTLTLDNTLGPMLVGTLISTALWGVTCTQAYDYFMDNTDGRLQRSIVAFLWVIDTFSSATDAHTIYYYLVTTYGHPTTKSIWSLNSLSLVSGITNFLIRSMFALRIYHFGRKNIILTSWIMLITICDFVVAIVTAVTAFKNVHFLSIQNISKLMYTTFALGLTADLSVTIGLCWLLHSAKSGFRKSDFTVNVLIGYVVNTSLLVTITATVGLITFAVMPNNLIFLAFFIPAGKFYLNAYLATLNARGRLRGNLDSNVSLSQLGISSSQGRDTQGILSTDEKTRPTSVLNSTLSVSFQKTVERRVDDV